MQGLFNNLAGVRSNTGGLYFEQGNYVVQIEALKLFTAGDHIPTFVTETVVLQSDNINRPVGCRPSQVVKIKPGNMVGTYLGNVKATVGALMGIDPDAYIPPTFHHLQGDELLYALNQWWEQCVLWAVCDNQPYRGYQIRLNCQDVPKKKGEGVFTKFFWGQVIGVPGQQMPQQG